MHILLIPSWYETPASPVRGIFFKHQALALVDGGHDVGIAYPELRGIHTLHRGRIQRGYQSGLEGPLRAYRYYGFRLPRQPVRFRRRWTEMAARLARMYVADHGTPDIIHAHCALFAGDVSHELSSEFRVPYVLTEHSSVYLRGALTELQRSCTKGSVAGASAVIAVSNRLKNALHEVTQRKTIHVVPNVVHTSRFAPLPRRRDTDAFRFVCIAILGPNKNIQLLIRAFHRAFAAEESVELEIVGDGAERRRLENVASGLKTGRRIVFRGAVDTAGVVEALRRSHCCVSSSNVETFGVTLIEALAAGIPVVATRSGGPQDIVTRECGHLVPVGDERALARAMRQVFEDRGMWEERTDDLSEYARHTYGPDAVVSRLEAVYGSL